MRTNRIAKGAVLAATALGMLAGGVAEANAASAPHYVPVSAQFTLASLSGHCGNGFGFGVDKTGELIRYSFTADADCHYTWGPGQMLGSGYTGTEQVLAQGDTVYTVAADGTLRWSAYDESTGKLAAGSGAVVGSGFNAFDELTYAGNGIFYGIKPNGVLDWYQDQNPSAGASGWYNSGNGWQIGAGFQGTDKLFANENGTTGRIFVNEAGSDDLVGYQFEDPSGNPEWGYWQTPNGIEVGTGWDSLNGVSTVTASNPNALYSEVAGLDANGDVHLYENTNFGLGLIGWSNGSGMDIGTPTAG
jgi:Tachylectin